MFKKKVKAVGLDIGSSSVKVVELAPGKIPRLVNYGIARVLPDAIVEGEIIDREVVLDAIRSAFEGRNIKTKSVVIGVAGHDVIIKKITMDRMSENDTREHIRWEAEQYIPFDINEVSIDFEIVNPNFGENQQEVVLVASKNELINNTISLVRELNLTPVAIDVAAFAIQNVFELNYGTFANETIALIHIGAGLTIINVVKNNVPLLARDIYFGANGYITRLQKELGMNYEDASSAIKGTIPMGITAEAINSVFESFADELSNQIEKSFQFLSSLASEEKLARIYISGGGSLIPNLLEYCKRRFTIPVERLNPFQKIGYDPAVFGVEGVETMSPILIQALGLALRGG
ncbi:MAG: type IV pilus assembly protein PilM [candidate division WOR-3 bacterium]